MNGILANDIDRQALEAVGSRLRRAKADVESQMRDLTSLRQEPAGLSASIDLNEFPAGARVALGKTQRSGPFQQLAETRAKIESSIRELEEFFRKLEEITEELDLATTSEVLDLCSAEGLDSLVIPLCRHPMSRRELKQRIQFASDVRDIATAATINFEPLADQINDFSALLESCITQIKLHTKPEESRHGR